MLFTYSFPKETVIATKTLYKDTKAMVCWLDIDTGFLAIVTRGNTSAPFLFIIGLGHVLKTSTDLIKENGLTLKKKKKQETDDIS